MNYKNELQDQKKEIILYRDEPEQNQDDQKESVEETKMLTNEEISLHLDLISNQTATIDDLIKSLTIIAQQSDFSEVSLFLFENEIYNVLYQQLSDFKKFSNPIVILHCMVIIGNILSLPGSELETIFMSDFQILFEDLVNHYSNGPPEVVSVIFDIFLTVMRPPLDISFFEYYIPFFAIYLKLHNPCKQPQLTLKSFKCCNKMFDIKHSGIQKKMLENNFLRECYIHMNRKTPSFVEACQLVGNICYLKPDSIGHFHDNFFTDLIPDLLADEDEKIATATLNTLISLSSNRSVVEILINEDNIFKKLLNIYDRGFEVKKRSIELLTILIESENPLIEVKLIDYGTLDFFAEYIYSEDDDIRKGVLAALTYLIVDFIHDQDFSNVPPPFVSVLINSQELVKSIRELSQEEGILDEIHESSTYAFNLCKEVLDRIN